MALGAALRWRGYLTDDGELVFYCPPCGVREFGSLEPRPLPFVWRWDRDAPPRGPNRPWTALELDDDL